MDKSNVVIVEDEALIAEDIRMALELHGHSVMDVVNRGEDSIRVINEKKPDVVIMDIMLSGDMDGIEAADIIQNKLSVPVIFLTAHNDEGTLARVRSRSPYGYILKPFRNKEVGIAVDLVRQRHEIEQKLVDNCSKLEDEVRRRREREKHLCEMSMMDDLTGLYNRRGFNVLFRQQKEIARRTERAMAVCFIDLDGMKDINDKWGHTEGDRALMDAARILENTYRSTDVIARWGGDEFAVLMINVGSDLHEEVAMRLQSKIIQYNRATSGFKLSMSMGMALYDIHNDMSGEEIVRIADEMMYREKEARRGHCRQ